MSSLKTSLLNEFASSDEGDTLPLSFSVRAETLTSALTADMMKQSRGYPQGNRYRDARFEIKENKEELDNISLSHSPSHS